MNRILVNINLFEHSNLVMNGIVVIIGVDVVEIVGVVSIDLNIYLKLVFNINGSRTILRLEVFN